VYRALHSCNVHRIIAPRLWMKYADDLQSLSRILFIQLAKRGRSAGAERTGVCPPANQNDMTTQILN
jgi:hypothetical protein